MPLAKPATPRSSSIAIGREALRLRARFNAEGMQTFEIAAAIRKKLNYSEGNIQRCMAIARGADGILTSQQRNDAAIASLLAAGWSDDDIATVKPTFTLERIDRIRQTLAGDPLLD